MGKSFENYDIDWLPIKPLIRTHKVRQLTEEEIDKHDPTNLVETTRRLGFNTEAKCNVNVIRINKNIEENDDDSSFDVFEILPKGGNTNDHNSNLPSLVMTTSLKKPEIYDHHIYRK